MIDCVIRHISQKVYELSIKDEISSNRYSFYFEGGIKSYVRHLNVGKEVVDEDVFYVDKDVHGTQIEIASQYSDSFSETIKTFANNVLNPDGGTHLTGFRSALTRVINDYAHKTGLLKEKEENLTGEDCREGLTAVILVKLADPQFEGQTKNKLGNPEIRGYVEQVLAEYFGYYLEEHPGVARKIVGKALLAARARKAARAAFVRILSAKEFSKARVCLANLLTVRRKILKIPGKFISWKVIRPEVRQRVAGIVKLRQFCRSRGKVLNVERARLDKMLANNEILSLIKALGVGIEESFDVKATSL